MFDIAIIGAGASGLAASIAAKRKNPYLSVALIEALPRVGKKILATGNGRCNITNTGLSEKDYNTALVSDIIKKYSPEKIIDFFSSLGLRTFSDSEGRVYPMSNTASSVLDCLRFEVQRLDIETICDTHIDFVEKKNGVFIINNDIKAEKLIIATGGKASPSQGSDGSGYDLLKTLGHNITSVYPGLVQLTVKENLRSLKGIRIKASVSLSGNNSHAVSSGEILFTDYGLSGIAVMDVSRCLYGKNCLCEIDCLPMMDKCETEAFLLERKAANAVMAVENVLSGLVPKKFGQYILKECCIPPDKPIGRLGNDVLCKIAEKLKRVTFNVTGTKGFTNAQITVGGADMREFNRRTLESEKIKNLYCTGELLDVDAVCGGFNLHWAWASGLAAGEAAAL